MRPVQFGHHAALALLAMLLAVTVVEAQEDRARGRFRGDGWEELVAVFDHNDRNRDAAISSDEWYSDRGTFRRLDRDRSGDISLSEFLGEGLGPEDAVFGSDVSEEPTGTMGSSVLQSEAYRFGYDRGMLDGRIAGREDRQLRNSWDLEGQQELEQADAGFSPSMGRRERYQLGYRTGFRAGYRQGFGPRTR
jgi:EF hand